MAPASGMKEKKGGGMFLLTCINEDNNNDRSCHHLDNVAPLLMCRFVTVHHHPSSIIGCHISNSDPCFLCKKRSREREHSSPGIMRDVVAHLLMLMCQVIAIHHCLFVDGCYIASGDMAPASCERKGDGEGMYSAHL
jgi:hypothetical protein